MTNITTTILRRIVFYVRVSTDGQDKDETDENQLRDLYKVYRKTDVVKVYKDVGSGADPNRTSLQELRADAKKGLFDVVAVWDTSRLARDTILALTLRAEFKALGIKIEVMGKEKDDSDDAKIYTLIESWMDEREREKIKSRFTSGKNRRLAEGKLIGSYPPYGYDHIRRDKEKGTDASFRINEKEAKVVLKVFKWYLELESIFLVTKRLFEKGIKTRGKGTEPKFFVPSMVKKILSRESYIGNHYFGKSSPCIAKFHIHKVRKHRLTGRRMNPRSDWKLVKIPAILNENVFNRVQEIMKKRGRHDSRIKQSKYEFLCKSLIRCDHCHRIYGTKLQKGYQLYACPQRRYSTFNEPLCKARTISRRKIDDIIWGYTKNLIENERLISDNIELARERRKKDVYLNQDNYELLLSEKNTIKNKKSKLLELYSDAENTISKNDIKNKLNDFDAREKVLDKQIVEVKKTLQDFEDMKTIEEEIKRIAAAYKGKLKNPSFKVKEFIVRKWIEEINILKDGGIRIKVNVPNGIPVGEYHIAHQDLHFTRKVVNDYMPLLQFEEVIYP